MRLQRVLLTAASVAALTATANAADMYGAPAADYVGVNWTGFYGGVNGGGAWAENEILPFQVYGVASAPRALLAVVSSATTSKASWAATWF